jgi:DNA-binding MarR family transcriptional regulator
MEGKKVEVLRKTFLALDRVMGNHARAEATCCGVTFPQCHTILEIGLAGKTSVKDLTGLLGLDKSTLSRTVDGLVNAGMVERAPDKNDRRYVVLTLSKNGRAVFERINNIWYQFCAELLENIPVKNHQQVVDSMTYIIEALQKNDLGKKYLKTCCK